LLLCVHSVENRVCFLTIIYVSKQIKLKINLIVMQKQKSGKISRTIILIVFLFTMCSAIYLIEYELVNIKHELRQEFVKSQSNLFKIRSQVENFKYKKKSFEEKFFKQKNLNESSRLNLTQKLQGQHISTTCCLKKLETNERDVQGRIITDNFEPSTKNLSKITLKDVNLLIKDPLKSIDRKETSGISKSGENQKVIEQRENSIGSSSNQSLIEDVSWMKVKVELNSFLKRKTPPNKNFIFHNKMPKCGSSTMNNIIRICSQNQGYSFQKIEPAEIGFYDDKSLVKQINNSMSHPYLLLKHHFYFDFTKFAGAKQPTYINVIRNPLDWFTSRYYFARYGWARKPGCRNVEDCKLLDIHMTIDECVEKRHPACTNSTYQYLPFLCGSEENCVNTTQAAKKRAYEISKQHILNNYYFVGILEQFEETLLLAEFLLPNFYKDALNVWKGDYVQERQMSTKTQNKKEMNEASKKFFLNGPLKYEKKLYDFARKVFNERLKFFKVKLPENSKR